ncbi:MAG TPA: flagellar hook protein FlgE [Azospira sp.]|nr:flagellar hook protein FlgE [Azospira sp.]
MAFQQGLSGLNTASKALDVISNNVANGSTVGFKAASAHFSDVYAASLTGAGSSQVGIGTSLAGVVQQFTQGNITTTNNPLDISINGGGFFRMSQNGAITFSRNGQFHLDKSGYIVNDANLRLTGYPADGSGLIVPSTPEEIQLSSSDQPPVATGSSVGAFQGVRGNINLDSRQTAPTTAWASGPAVAAAPATTLWSPNPSSYNYSTALSVYDTLGNAHTLTYYFVKTATAGEWDVYANVDGTTNQTIDLGAGAGNPATLQFDSSGVLQTAMPLSISINLNGVVQATGSTNNAGSPLAFDVDFTGSTQFGSAFGTNRLEQDGYTSGRLSGLTVGADGIIQGRYSNGQARNLGQIVLANFTNPNGLINLGGNVWSESSVSGAPMVGAPSTGSLGVLQSAAVEESNVDLTAELVNMITQQRNYQANAQSIKTQDQVMQTLVNLR